MNFKFIRKKTQFLERWPLSIVKAVPALCSIFYLLNALNHPGLYKTGVNSIKANANVFSDKTTPTKKKRINAHTYMKVELFKKFIKNTKHYRYQKRKKIICVCFISLKISIYYSKLVWNLFWNCSLFPRICICGTIIRIKKTKFMFHLLEKKSLIGYLLKSMICIDFF